MELEEPEVLDPSLDDYDRSQRMYEEGMNNAAGHPGAFLAVGNLPIEGGAARMPVAPVMEVAGGRTPAV